MAEFSRKDFGPPPEIRYTFCETFPDGSQALMEMEDELGNPIPLAGREPPQDARKSNEADSHGNSPS